MIPGTKHESTSTARVNLMPGHKARPDVLQRNSLSKTAARQTFSKFVERKKFSGHNRRVVACNLKHPQCIENVAASDHLTCLSTPATKSEFTLSVNAVRLVLQKATDSRQSECNLMSNPQQPMPEDPSADADTHPHSEAQRPRSTNRRPSRWLILFKPKVGIPLAILIVLATIFWKCIDSHLSSIPPVDAPFDIDAFCSETIPDSENAFVEYRKAFELFVESSETATSGYSNDKELMAGRFDKASDEVLAWLDANDAAFKVWLDGTKKPSGSFVPRSDVTFDSVAYLRTAMSLSRLATLNAGRLLHEKKPKEAWKVLHATFRFSRHVGQNGILRERYAGTAAMPLASLGIVAWAHDSATTAADIDRAIEVLSRDYAEMTSPYSDAFKLEYIASRKLLSTDTTGGWLSDPRPRSESPILRGLSQSQRSALLLDLVLRNHLAGIDQDLSTGPSLLPDDFRLFDLEASPTQPVSGIELAELISQPMAMQLPAELPKATNALKSRSIQEIYQATMLAVLCIEHFVREEGHLPATIEETCDESRRELIIDPFHPGNQPLIYRSNPEFAVVYTLGYDGIDSQQPLLPPPGTSTTLIERLSRYGRTEGFRIPLLRRHFEHDELPH
ncbi:MAG: hypothetical protein O2945_09175 [Planctomycetota bacterium]|nr:hypothetical protein [Planctomycetota bacterium]